MSVGQPLTNETQVSVLGHPAAQSIMCDESLILTCSHEMFAFAYIGVTCHGYMRILV